MLVRSGIRLLKYWFSITDEEQYLRFLGRIHDPLKQWKLSPMDLESRRRWEDYTKAKEVMLERSHIPEARWWVVHAVDKKRARLNAMRHILHSLSYVDKDETFVGAPDPLLVGSAHVIYEAGEKHLAAPPATTPPADARNA